MQRIVALLFFVLSVCLAQTSEARKLALLVGVDDYANVTPLRCCVNDMKALKAALLNVGFMESDILILTTGGSVRDLPTKKNIEQKVAEILAAASPGDLVFFAFSGHGAREGDTDYFCPPFVETNDLEGTCVSITKVMDDLSKCKASFKWMVVDACRNDPSRSRDARAFQVIPSPPQGVALFQSCNKGEKSYEENRDGGNGYFTKNLVAALSGEADSNHDGRLTLLEVCAWTSSQTQVEVERVENKTQRPYLNLSAADFTLSQGPISRVAMLIEEARKAVEEEKYELAVEKYDEALALYPQNESWKQERLMAQRLLSRLKAGERKTYTVNGVEFAFRYCPPGTFMMGSPEDEVGRRNDETQHEVTLTKGFWMMETEVTVGMFKAFVSETGYDSQGKTPFGWADINSASDPKYSWRNPGFSQDDSHPVTCVSCDDAEAFCEWLSKKTGQKITLPTEAQWEYACRAGTTGEYAGNLYEMAWLDGRGGTHSVRTKKPNAWGLFDMHGNVWEWCQDWRGDYPHGSVTDPTGPATGAIRVYRGGGWNSFSGSCRSAFRSGDSPKDRDYELGFRCVIGQ